MDYASQAGFDGRRCATTSAAVGGIGMRRIKFLELTLFLNPISAISDFTVSQGTVVNPVYAFSSMLFFLHPSHQ
jgi:hypothetical protein